MTDDGASLVDFHILQAPLRRSEMAAEWLEALHSAGIQVFIDGRFYLSGEQRRADEGSDDLESVDWYLEGFEEVLAGATTTIGVSIEEENVPRRAEFLETLYHELTAAHPEHDFYQWYSPTQRLNVPGCGPWPELPAAGWVFDQYFHTYDRCSEPVRCSEGGGVPETVDCSGSLRSAYEEYVLAMRKLDGPLLSNVWASPNWVPGPRRVSPDWWNEEGWKTFYLQVAVNKKYGIPTAFFSFFLSPPESGSEWVVTALFAVADERYGRAQRFWTRFVATTLPHLRSSAVIDTTIPAARPSWIPAYE